MGSETAAPCSSLPSATLDNSALLQLSSGNVPRSKVRWTYEPLLFATAWRLLLSQASPQISKDCSALYAEQRRARDLPDLSRGLRRLGVSPPRELTRKRSRFYAMSEVPWPSRMAARCDAAPRPYRPTMPISKVFAELASGVAQATGKPLTFARTTGRFV
jgi:hypothetical protein